MERRARSRGGGLLEEQRGEGKGLPPTPHAQRSPPALGGWSTSGVLMLMFPKSVSGNSLELGFSHVYLQADVILCQPQGTGGKSHT